MTTRTHAFESGRDGHAPGREALAALPVAALEALMRAGQPLAPSDLAGFTYRGTALALPAPLARLVAKFKKAFWDDGARVRGWNVRMRQNGPDAPWVAATFAGRPIVYGHFVVLPAGDAPGEYPGAVLLDYGLGEPRLSPLAPVRDHLIALDPVAPGRPAERVLGRMRLALAGRTIPTPSYFLLERDAPIDAPARPPRWSPLRRG